jgi:nucleoside-diphosphate-sugar epimerase
LYKYLNNYALSKKQFAEWLRLLAGEDQIKGINIKIEHMYGPKDDQSKFVAWLVKQLTNSTASIPLTRGEQKRDFVHISDVVSAYLTLLERTDALQNYDEFEVGTGQAVPLKEFVLQMKEAIKKHFNQKNIPSLDFGALPYREGEFMEIKADIKKLRELGWQPKYSYVSGIERYISEVIN